MPYRITGLATELFADLIGRDDAMLAAHNAVRVTATKQPGFPCRISLQDATPGETLLLHPTSLDVATPYRSSYAIYSREGATQAASYNGTTPPVFEGRPLDFRAFDATGTPKNAALAVPGQADAKIRELFDVPEIAYIHAHNAAHGCFAARVDRA